MNRRSVLILLLAVLLPAGLAAQTATLVRDVNPNPPAPDSQGSNPRQFAAVSGRAVFLTGGKDPSNPDYRLWATDGTDGGTTTLLRFCPQEWCPEPRRLAEVSGTAFFLADSPVLAGLRVWRTDGTREGTFPVSPALNSQYGYVPFVVAGRRLLFGGCEDFEQCSLWSVDAAARTAEKLLDIEVYGMVAAGRRIFLAGSDGEADGLWITDGTAAGTAFLKKGPLDSLTVSGSRVFFLAGGYDYPNELWTSDGTKEGTRFIRSFVQPNHYVPPFTAYLKPVNGGIVFVGLRGDDYTGLQLWWSDGTRKGTRPLTVASAGLKLPWENQIAVLRGRIFFIADNGVTGPRLWSTRGTVASTAPVTGCAGGCPALLPGSPLVAIGDRLVFAAKDPVYGAEPWTSDGTGAGTHILRDLCPGPCGSNPEAFTPHNGWLDFRATWDGQARLVRTDGALAVPLAVVASDFYGLDLADVGSRTFFAGFDPHEGRQPWVTDGSQPGTRRVASLGISGASSHPRDFAALGDRLLFTASDGTERSLWTVSPDSAAAPLPGTGVPEGRPGPSGVTVAGGLAFFVLDRGPDGNAEIWRTDGTASGTLQLASFQDKRLSELREFGGKLLFLASSTTGERPLHAFWASDGTPAGTVKRFDLPADTVTVGGVEVLGPDLFFIADGENTIELFHSDGTAQGTRKILDEFCDCLMATRSGGSIYLMAGGDYGLALFRTDGTAEGTVQVLPDPEGDFDGAYEPVNPFEFQGDLYFFAMDSDPESPFYRVLWKGRSTADAVLLKQVGWEGDEFDAQFTVLGGQLYFRAWDPEHGTELWRTDGTPEGTVLVSDILPGPRSSDPQGIVIAGGRLYFSAQDVAHGRELWTSDGTAAGTRLVTDLAPREESSTPEQLTPAGGRLFFTADDGVVGREPWSVPVDR